MTPPSVSPATIVRDPAWLAHRYDPGHDAVHFVAADRTLRREVPFLTDDNLPGAGAPVVLRRSDAVGVSPPAPVNFIFHSAYCCSTLLANAYDRPGKAFSLKEPVLLNDLVGWRHRGGTPDQIGDVLNTGLSLLARPFAVGERCIVKPSNIVNGLAAAAVAMRPDAGVLLIHAPLEAYLGSIASKGLWGRRWVRDLLLKQLTERFVDLGFEQQDYFLQTDLQVAAVGWLAQHKVFANIAARWPDRVRTIDSETLVARPAEALAALDALFGVADDDAGRARILATVFSRNAKFGDAFDPGQRRSSQRAAADTYGDEIAKVAQWAAAVAENAGIAMVPPRPLLPTG